MLAAVAPAVVEPAVVIYEGTAVGRVDAIKGNLEICLVGESVRRTFRNNGGS